MRAAFAAGVVAILAFLAYQGLKPYNLEDWYAKKGIELSKAKLVDYGVEMGVGVQANTIVEEGEEVARVPYGHIVAPSAIKPGGFGRILKAANDMDDEVYLALFMMLSKKMEKLHARPFIHLLSSRGRDFLPMTWPAEKRALMDPYLRADLEFVEEALLRDYDVCRSQVFRKEPTFFDGAFSWEEFRHACAVVAASCVHDGDELVYIPVVDKINHAANATTKITFDEEHMMVILRSQARQPGEQIFLNYGIDRPDTLFLRYGFYDASAEEVDSPFYMTVPSGVIMGQNTRVPLYDGRLSTSMLAAMRAKESTELMFHATHEPLPFTSRKNEGDAMKMVIFLCKALLKEIGDPPAIDAQALAAQAELASLDALSKRRVFLVRSTIAEAERCLDVLENPVSNRDVTVAPLTGGVGAEVRGIDVALPMDDDVVQRLRDALAAHPVLVLRDQLAVLPADQANFVERLSGGKAGVFGTTDGTPHSSDSRVVEENSRAFAVRPYFHTDGSSHERPAALTSWLPSMLPERLSNGVMQFAPTCVEHLNVSAAQLEGLKKLYTLHRTGLAGPLIEELDSGDACVRLNLDGPTVALLDSTHLGEDTSGPLDPAAVLPIQEAKAIIGQLEGALEAVAFRLVLRQGDMVVIDNSRVAFQEEGVEGDDVRILLRTSTTGTRTVPRVPLDVSRVHPSFLPRTSFLSTAPPMV